VTVTVAMPAYNAAASIRSAIASVIPQLGRATELVVVDDGSDDDTWKRMAEFRRHPRVRLLRNRARRGVGATRNRLTSLARYVMPCDADDLLLPGAVERFSAYLNRHPNVGAVYADVLEVMTDRRGIVTRPPAICGANHRRTWDLLDNVINHPGSLIRKRLIEQVGGYDERVYSIDDWSLWLKLAEVSRIVHLKGELYYIWRRRPSGVTRTDRNWHRDVVRIRLEAIARRYGVYATGSSTGDKSTR